MIIIIIIIIIIITNDYCPKYITHRTDKIVRIGKKRD